MTDPGGDAPDAVPEEVINQAKAAFGRRKPGPVAVLVWDSLVDDNDSPEDHRLVFEHADVQIELRVRVSDQSVDLEGQVKPALVLQVELESEQGDVLDHADTSEGAFTIHETPPGVVRLALRGGTGPDIHTDWFRI